MGEKSKKEKKAKRESVDEGTLVSAVKKEYLAPIAKPLADDKLCKKVRIILYIDAKSMHVLVLLVRKKGVIWAWRACRF